MPGNLKITEKIKKQIKKVCDENSIGLKDIILFGSRARNEADKTSDYDILVITDKLPGIKEKMNITKQMRVRLSEYPVDIILKTEKEAEALKNNIGMVVREALKEGVRL